MLKVTATLDHATATALLASGYRLYAFKAVRNSDAAGKVLVWYASDVISQELSIAWTPDYAAYVTRSEQDPPDISAMFPIECGQTVHITDAVGAGSIVRNGQPGAITIVNDSDVQFRSGIAQSAQGKGLQALSSFPLYGHGSQVITPIETILLAFSTCSWQLGQIVNTLSATSPPLIALFASSGALLVTTSETDNTVRQVQFDINHGWNWDDAHWGRAIASTAPLAPLLILPDS